MARTSRTHDASQSGTLARLARAFSFLAIALLLVGACVGSLPNKADAAEDESEANRVDPTQRADNSFIYDTTIDSLFNQASLYDERTVQIVGEVIGDRIIADRYGNVWITLTATETEDKSTISVLMSEDQASQIDRYGKYGVTGTILQVRGTYHQACSEHDSLPDIHATESSVMSRGLEKPDEFVASEFAPGIVAIILGFALMGAFLFARERMR